MVLTFCGCSLVVFICCSLLMRGFIKKFMTFDFQSRVAIFLY